MNFKRYNGRTWETVRHKRYGSGTDSLTAFPAMIQASGEPLTDYTIYGNSFQDGTPSPEAPVDVVGCGEKTGNLFDISTATLGKYIDAQGVETNSTAPTPVQALNHTDYIEIQPNTDYTYHYKYGAVAAINTIALCWFDASKNLISRNTKDISPQETEYTLTGTSPANAAFCIINFTGYLPNKSMKLSFNLGSTAIPYEPYGYKLPLTVNGTEYPIYLGQVETTRRIKELVLTGSEAWSSYSGVVYLSNVIDYLKTDAAVAICTHYQPQPSVEGVGDTTTGHIAFSKGSNYRLCIRDTTYTSANTFKQYLAAQYAAGTPVTVWYVLANPETGIVNEPLHKIGDNADTITMAQAGIAIPTSDGDNTISFGTTVQPSAMSAAFKGWHPVQGAKQYDGNDWR